MTPEERILEGGVTLVFDAANVSTRTLFPLAKKAAACGKALRVVVPVTAHLEKLTHLRWRLRLGTYRAADVRKALEDAEVKVIWLDEEAAESVAERLCEWFPTKEAWRDAKWTRLHSDKSGSMAGRAPATIDWITAAMCPPGAIVVTDDTGPEFRDCFVIGSAALAAVLRELVPGDS